METGFSQLNADLVSVTRRSFLMLDQSRGDELYLCFTLDTPFPVPVHLHRDGCFSRIEGDRGCLRVPVFTGELKHFFPDYKNYEYLPAEDRAIHRSVAQFVDKTHRVRASRDTCYVKRYGTFLPVPPAKRRSSYVPEYEPPVLPDCLPLFQEAYRSRICYVEAALPACDTETEQKEKDMVLYLNHVLKVLLSFKKS